MASINARYAVEGGGGGGGGGLLVDYEEVARMPPLKARVALWLARCAQRLSPNPNPKPKPKPNPNRAVAGQVRTCPTPIQALPLRHYVGTIMAPSGSYLGHIQPNAWHPPHPSLSLTMPATATATGHGQRRVPAHAHPLHLSHPILSLTISRAATCSCSRPSAKA